MKNWVLSTQAKQWIQNHNKTSYTVIGVHFDGMKARVAWNDVQMTYDMKQGFYVPYSLLDTHYNQKDTYRTVFRDFIGSMASHIRSRIPDGILMFVCSVPNREQWNRDMTKYVSFIQECLQNIDTQSFVVCISLSEIWAYDAHTLYVSMERDWTELTYKKDAKTILQTAVHLGAIHAEQTDICIRMNDYVHNSTTSWDEFCATDLFDGYTKIMNSLFAHGWDTVKTISVICSDETFHIWEQLQNGSVCRNCDISRNIANLFIQEHMQTKIQTNTDDDLWSL